MFCVVVDAKASACVHSCTGVPRQWHQVSTQYPAHAKGTGVLVDYQGYSCIVAGKHVLSSPVAASTALVHFVLPGVQRIVTVSLIATRGYPCRKTAAAEMIHACK